MTRQDIIDELWRRKFNCIGNSAILVQPTHAYCNTTEPLILHKWDGKSWDTQSGKPITTAVPIPTGTTLKIVMISRLGDFGLTDDLDAENGYHIRLGWESEQITNVRLKK